MLILKILILGSLMGELESPAYLEREAASRKIERMDILRFLFVNYCVRQEGGPEANLRMDVLVARKMPSVKRAWCLYYLKGGIADDATLIEVMKDHELMYLLKIEIQRWYDANNVRKVAGVPAFSFVNWWVQNTEEYRAFDLIEKSKEIRCFIVGVRYGSNDSWPGGECLDLTRDD